MVTEAPSENLPSLPSRPAGNEATSRNVESNLGCWRVRLLAHVETDERRRDPPRPSGILWAVASVRWEFYFFFSFPAAGFSVCDKLNYWVITGLKQSEDYRRGAGGV